MRWGEMIASANTPPPLWGRNFLRDIHRWFLFLSRVRYICHVSYSYPVPESIYQVVPESSDIHISFSRLFQFSTDSTEREHREATAAERQHLELHQPHAPRTNRSRKEKSRTMGITGTANGRLGGNCFPIETSSYLDPHTSASLWSTIVIGTIKTVRLYYSDAIFVYGVAILQAWWIKIIVDYSLIRNPGPICSAIYLNRT